MEFLQLMVLLIQDVDELMHSVQITVIENTDVLKADKMIGQ